MSVLRLPERPASCRFPVWAPGAQRLTLVLDSPEGERYELERLQQPDGWWALPEGTQQSAACALYRPGRRYAYGVDGEGPFPDPRSRCQPDGPHSFSEVLPEAFPWSDHAWRGAPLAGQVIYELHTGTFSSSGTFNGVLEHLDHLQDLGVTAIELMPVQPFGGQRNWGYDGVEWLAVHSGYGGPTGLKKLVNECHGRGISVILDVVYNHFGPDGNYAGVFGPYTAPGNTAWGEVVNIGGAGSDEVRRLILDSVRQWLEEFHVDGLRLDAVHAYDDRGAYSLMEQIAAVARGVEERTGRATFIIAESDLNDPRLVTPVSAGGYGLDAQWNDDVHHALHALVSGERDGYYADFGAVGDLADTLCRAYFYDGRFSSFRGRLHGRPVDLSTTPASRFLAYTTTHDQTGNRARGDRPSMNLSPQQLTLKFAVVACAPFTPMLFMGEEFAARTPFPFFCSHTDEELNRLTSEGRKREFARMGWDEADIPTPSDPATFHAARLEWAFDEDQRAVVETYRQLLRLRRELGLSDARFTDVQVDYCDDWMVLYRRNRRYALATNFSDHPTDVPVDGTVLAAFQDSVLPSPTSCFTRLAPWGWALLDRGGETG